MRAYPNVQYHSVKLPAKIDLINYLNISATWSLGLESFGATPETPPNTGTNAEQMSSNGINCDVAIDMFADASLTKSINSTVADYEIMIWIARVGNDTYPSGYSDPLDPAVVVQLEGYNL